MRRIIIHWTAGTDKVSDIDREHYHFIVGGDGKVVPGTRQPEANRDTRDGDYAAHTRRLNTGSIGIAMAGMAGAVERPFSAGKYPLTEAQVEALCEQCADLCETYDIPVTPRTVLMHSEVQPTLGVAQRGKWDCNWLPGMDGPEDAIAVGNRLRARIQQRLQRDTGRTSPVQSTTMQAGFAQIGSATAGGVGALASLDGQAQIVALVICAVVALAALYIMSERLRKWAEGDR